VRTPKPLAQRSRQRQADLWLAAHEVQEAATLQPEHLGRRLRSNASRARPAGQQGHLAERRPRAQRVDAALVALGRRDIHSEGALDDKVEGVARISLLDHRGAGLHGHGLEMGGQLRERAAIEPGEEVDPGQDRRVLDAGRLARAAWTVPELIRGRGLRVVRDAAAAQGEDRLRFPSGEQC
jgi:hypothetical protein